MRDLTIKGLAKRLSNWKLVGNREVVDYYSLMQYFESWYFSRIDTLPYIRSGTKSAIFWKQFKLNFFGSIWVIETQKNWFREKIFKNKESTGGFWFFGRFSTSWKLIAVKSAMVELESHSKTPFQLKLYQGIHFCSQNWGNSSVSRLNHKFFEKKVLQKQKYGYIYA